MRNKELKVIKLVLLQIILVTDLNLASKQLYKVYESTSLWQQCTGQLNLQPTRPNGLVGYKLQNDLLKISVKEATHMGFVQICDSQIWGLRY